MAETVRGTRGLVATAKEKVGEEEEDDEDDDDGDRDCDEVDDDGGDVAAEYPG